MATQEEIDDWIAMKLMRQNAPLGSVQQTINQRWPRVGWDDQAEMTPSVDAGGEPEDVAYSGMDAVGLQHFWRNLPAMTNEAGAAAWMETPGPMSENIEDRSGQTNMDVAKGLIRTMGGMGARDEDLSHLSPQEYINQVIGGMHNNDFYYGPGAEDYHLVHGVAPRDFDQADFYPMRKVSR